MFQALSSRGTVLAAAAILAVLSGIGSARASEDAKIYAGANCLPGDSSTIYSRDPVNGWIRNISGFNTATFVCPIVRDVAAGSVEFAGVTLAGSALSSCSLAAQTGLSGRGFSVGPSAIRPVRGTDFRRLQFADGSANFATAANVPLFIVCRIAPAGSIVTYSLDENDGED